jgi:hypothetical protein
MSHFDSRRSLKTIMPSDVRLHPIHKCVCQILKFKALQTDVGVEHTVPVIVFIRRPWK